MIKTQQPPRLKQFAGFWTLMHQPSKEKEWTREEKIQRAKEAGFDAMGGGAMPEVAEAVRAAGMEYICYIDANGESYEERLKAAAATKPVRVNVQLCDHDTLPKDAVKVWMKMQPVAKKLGLQIDLEVHRDTCTETPEKTYEIAERYKKAAGKKCRFCFDFSHIAVVKHLGAPYAARLLEHPDLVRLSRQMHLRPFNGHHCQIPVTDGQGNFCPEFLDYLQFVDDLLGCWMKGAKGGEVLYVCPELGCKVGYGLTSFPNVWDDAVRMRSETEKIWNKHLAKWKEGR